MAGGLPCCCTEDPHIPAEAFSFSRSFIDLAGPEVVVAVGFEPSDIFQRSSKFPPDDFAEAAGEDLANPGDVTFDRGCEDVGVRIEEPVLTLLKP